MSGRERINKFASSSHLCVRANLSGANPETLRGCTVRGIDASLRLEHSQAVQRTFHPAAALAHDMRVNHRGGNIFMAQQFLDRPDVRPAL